MKPDMNPAIPRILQTPVLPAAILLFGLLFCFALAHFARLAWTQVATIIFYVFLFIWGVWILWQRRTNFLQLKLIDMLFTAYIITVLISLATTQNESVDTTKYMYYMPFMLVLPYICGRLMYAPDRDFFMRISLIGGVLMLPLLLLDRFTSVDSETGRWAFFGQNHGALLVGSLIATALIALCVQTMYDKNSGYIHQFINYGLVGLMTIFLVWVTARGWLLAGLLGGGVVCWATRHHTYVARIGLLALMISVTVLSFTILPKFDPAFARMSSIQINLPPLEKGRSNGEMHQPILGEASCKPIQVGADSIAIRGVLYQEAMAMFSKNPIFGIGATKFGEQSCAGLGSFPHSTILQSLAELGGIGGGLFIGLLTIASVTLLRRVVSNRINLNQGVDSFTLALFVAFILSDQIYGNYFMSVGTWLMLGIAAGMNSKSTYGDNNVA